MIKRSITYQKKYDPTKRPKNPIAIVPNHYFKGNYSKIEVDGTRRWWIDIVGDEFYQGDERGVMLDEAEMRALATAIEAALDDADRSMEEAVKEHNKFVTEITGRRNAKMEGN